MCVTYIRPFGESRWVEYHRTERIDNCHDPHFVSKVNMIYRFEEQQFLKFELYDCDSTSSDLGAHDFLGWASCTLAQIINGGKVPYVVRFNISSIGFTENAFTHLSPITFKLIINILF